MLASYGVGDVLFFKSTQSLGVPGALAIASSFPIFTVLAGVVLNGDSVSVRQYAGLFATVAGVIFIILSGHASPVIPVAGSQAPRFESLQKGVLLAFGAAICWAINGFTVSRGGVGISPCVGNTLRMGLALGIIALIARATAGPGTPLLLPGVELKRWAWLFTLEAFGGSLFFLYGLSRSPLVIGTTLASLAPALSMPVAVMMGVERFSWRRAMGIVSVVSGVWLLISGR